jgi:hypothetical protein
VESQISAKGVRQLEVFRVGLVLDARRYRRNSGSFEGPHPIFRHQLNIARSPLGITNVQRLVYDQDDSDEAKPRIHDRRECHSDLHLQEIEHYPGSS